MQQVLDVLWDQLLPALDADAGGVDRYASEARLTERLESLTLPVVVPTHEGPDGTVRFVVEEEAADQPLGLGLAALGHPRRRRPSLGLTFDILVAVPCGVHRWAEGRLGAGGVSRGFRRAAPSEPTPVVCRGGWTGRDTFEADLVLIETPHRIRLRATVLASRRRGTGHPCPVRPQAHLPR